MSTADDAPTPRPHPLALLHDPRTIRLRCRAVLRAVEDNLSGHFRLDRGALPALADEVAAITRERFPTLAVPPHSRWRHFEAGGVDRKAEMDAALAAAGHDRLAVARARFDLAVVSVLLDAGAGADWRYTEGRALAATARPTASADELFAALDRAATRESPRAAAAADVAADGTADVVADVPADVPADAAAAGAGGETAKAGAVADAAVAAPAPAPPVAPAATPSATAPAAEPGSDAPPNTYARSEGLGVASFRGFAAGVFSARRDDPWRADAETLRHIDAAALRALFQSGPSNPVVGLEGRATLLARLGAVLAEEAARDTAAGRPTQARPALLFDRVTDGGRRSRVSAPELLAEVLRTLAPIWPSGPRIKGTAAGDVWPHRWAGSAVPGGGDDPTTAGWVPFHKLSQWLVYSLVEPLAWAGIEVDGLDGDGGLTGLPEYRNGGLFIDGGVLLPRSASLASRRFKPGDELVVEWRALTVCLLDELAPLVRERLGPGAAALPLACVLEGGTWAAGRALAARARPGGAPPIAVDSDGTVF